MKATVYSVEGKAVRQMDLPGFFESALRDDLVKRAVLSDESRLYQPKGNYKFAGLETSARYRGRKEDFGAVKNKGIPHLPHEVLPKGQLGKVKRVPHAVKGRRAHPPKPEKILIEEMNRKEYLKALACALAATADRKAVCDRCHGDVGPSLPIVMEDAFESLVKTHEVAKSLGALNVLRFVDKARESGTKSPLLVVSGEVPLLRSGRNLAGVDVVAAKDLQVRHLAPGTHHGRITLYTPKALAELERRLSGTAAKPKKGAEAGKLAASHVKKGAKARKAERRAEKRAPKAEGQKKETMPAAPASFPGAKHPRTEKGGKA